MIHRADIHGSLHALAAARLAGCAIALYAGCADPAPQTCMCPAELRCVDTGSAQVCAARTCGDGRLDPGESCDDGNNRSGDGCPADCRPPCGDGVLDPGEACDDGNKVDGDGCAADCRSLDGLFLVTPAMVSFTASEGGALPAPITVKARLEYRGDMVVIGYAPGVPQPTWLSIANGPTGATSAELELQATDTAVIGERLTSVRLMLRHPNSTGLKTFDLPVAFSVEPSDLAVQATPATLAFTAGARETGVPSQAVDVTFNGADVSVVSFPPWAAVSGPTAATSPASFAVSITNTSFAAGTLLSGDIVFRTTRDSLQRTTSVHVTCHVVAPGALTIQAVPAVLAFTAFHGGVIPPPQDVSVAFNGEVMGILSVPSWLTVSRSGSTSPATLTVSVKNTSFAGGTTQSDDILISTTRGGELNLTSVHVDYHVVLTPEVQFVAPYVGIAGRPGTLRLRGHGFRGTSILVTVGIGDLRIGPVVTEGDTQITVSYPALPAGRYPVSIVDPPGIAPTAPELVITAPPVFSYQAVEAPSPRTRIIYDAERQAIYGVNKLDQQIEHFVYEDGAWSTHSPHVVPQLADAALTPNGRSLIVIDPDHVNEMSLTDHLFVPVVRRDNPAAYIGSFCDQSAAADNGKVLVLLGSSCSQSYLYDVLDRSLDGVSSFVGYPPVVGASADGSRIYLATAYQNDPQTVQVFASLSNVTQYIVLDLYMYAMSVSGNASRVIMGNSSVYSRALTLLGYLPAHGVALASRDSSRAFVYVDDDAGPRLEVYDLNGPLLAGAVYPLVRTVTLRDAANSDGPHGVAMTTTLDDAVVFISGNRRLLIVPVD